MALALGERWDQSFARTLDHLRRALPRERAEVLIQPGAGVRPDLVDERLAIPIEGARAPVRALEALLTLVARSIVSSSLNEAAISSGVRSAPPAPCFPRSNPSA